MGTRQKEDSIGERTKEDKERCRICCRREYESYTQEVRGNKEWDAEKFIGIEGKGLEIMKRIGKARKEVEKKEKANKSEDLS